MTISRPPAVVVSRAPDSITIDAEPESLTIGPSTTALVVVDMQNAYLSKGGYLDRVGFDVTTSPPVIEKAAAVLAAARTAGLFIVHLQNGFDELQTEAGGPTAPVWHKSNALKYMRANPWERGKLITHGTWDPTLSSRCGQLPAKRWFPRRATAALRGPTWNSCFEHEASRLSFWSG
ncbi:nicotinamidase-related amidase [Nitrobacteraceae bacterium AZCC 2161]